VEEIKLIIDDALLDEYADYYFKKHPRARKKPIEKPWHPSINQWMILPRIQMNALKQKWKDFGVWWIEKLGYTDMMLRSFDMTFTVFRNTRRRVDPDNCCPKMILDSFTESGFIVDDDGKHLHSLTLKTDYDKEYPRTEILVRILDEE
jgi:Holliday junction resolvase RusA-like endonuclease